jgi:uncharacterized protein YqiB (DUF1249 family)
MSCGNRFQCGITRFQKHSFTPDKPSNVELHNENQQRLNELLKAREEMDKMVTTNVQTEVTKIRESAIIAPAAQYTSFSPLPQETTFTPWKTPSTQEPDKKTK